jgi:hypothetical protein
MSLMCRPLPPLRQADLRVEQEHLRRFYNNFKGVGSSVHVPRPIDGQCGGGGKHWCTVR